MLTLFKLVKCLNITCANQDFFSLLLGEGGEGGLCYIILVCKFKNFVGASIPLIKICACISSFKNSPEALSDRWRVGQTRMVNRTVHKHTLRAIVMNIPVTSSPLMSHVRIENFLCFIYTRKIIQKI